MWRTISPTPQAPSPSAGLGAIGGGFGRESADVAQGAAVAALEVAEEGFDVGEHGVAIVNTA